MSTNTVRLHRVLPERVYRAFLGAGALANWLPPHGFTCQVHALDAGVVPLHTAGAVPEGV